MKKIVAPESSKVREVSLRDAETGHEQSDLLKAHKRALQHYENKKQLLYPLEKIAQDTLVIRNVKYPGADEDYPLEQHALFRFVSKLYPNAVGGPLYVDEPRNDVEVHRAYERHERMKLKKIRHVVVERDTSYEHLLEQLGEM
jgi:hypothetical protein